VAKNPTQAKAAWVWHHRNVRLGHPADHSTPHTTKLYDQRDDETSLDEDEKSGFEWN
jgi:hypothetical protein